MQAANKVIFNTGILYFKMLITVGIALYTTRLVLNALGVVDYGLYNLIAGIISMLSFLNAAMTTSTQRYLSFHQGTNNLKIQKDIFSNSLLLHIAIGAVIVCGLLLAGLFLFDGVLNIPNNRIATAKLVYYLMSFTVFLTVLSVPFTASLNAHENMLWIAVVNIVEVLLKLGVALILYIYGGDKLIFYAWAMAAVSFISLLLYSIFCLEKYSECSLYLKGKFNKKMIAELTSFAGWNLFGALCGVGRTQGLAVILNFFLGTLINAAYGIANQIAGQMNFFSATMLRAMNPQIMQNEGAGNHQKMLYLSMMASKYGFFLLAFIAIPCIFEMPAILKFWLKDVPEYTVIFCILTLILAMTNQLTIGLQSAIQATGRIKVYQSVVGSVILLNLPVSFVLLYYNFPVYYTLISAIIIEFFACSFRLFFLHKKAGLSIVEYVNRVLKKEVLPVLITTLACFLFVENINFEYRFVLTIIFSISIFFVSIFLFGLEKEERLYIIQIIKQRLKK